MKNYVKVLGFALAVSPAAAYAGNMESNALTGEAAFEIARGASAEDIAALNRYGNLPAAVAPAPAEKDIFERNNECSSLTTADENLHLEFSLDDSVVDLQHCMKRLAKNYGAKIMVEKELFLDESGIKISVVPRRGDGAAFTRELEAALGARGGRLLGYKAWVVLYSEPGVSVSGDVFKLLPRCAALDRKYKKQPGTGEVIKMLGRCAKDVTARYGNAVYAEPAIIDPDTIQLVILDSVAGTTIVEDLRAAVAARRGVLFGHPVKVSVMDPDYGK